MKFNTTELYEKINAQVTAKDPNTPDISIIARATASGVIESLLDMAMNGDLAYAKRRFDQIMTEGYNKP